MHSTEIDIRAYHCDGYGHVNNARYLELLDEARWRAWEAIDYGWFAERQMQVVVSRIDIRYLREAVIGDRLTIETELMALNVRDGVFRQCIERAGKRVAEAMVTFAVLGPASRRALAIEDELKARLLGLGLRTDESTET